MRSCQSVGGDSGNVIVGGAVWVIAEVGDAIDVSGVLIALVKWGL